MALHDWFLTTQERGNPQSVLDVRHAGASHTEGNEVHALVDGATYFAALREAVQRQRSRRPAAVHRLAWRS